MRTSFRHILPWLLAYPVAVYSQGGSVSLYPAAQTVACDTYVDVPIRASRFRSMLSMQGTVEWDASVLRFDSLSGYGNASLSMQPSNFGRPQGTSDRLLFSWNDASLAGISLPDSATLFTIRLSVITRAPLTATVRVTSGQVPLELMDTTYTTLPVTGASASMAFLFRISGYNPFPPSLSSRADTLRLDAGSGYAGYDWSTGARTQSIAVRYSGSYRVTVTNTLGCTASDTVLVRFPDTVGIFLPSVDAKCGTTVDMPVRVSAFRNLASMQGSLGWNAADLRYEGISSYGPASMGLAAGNFGATQAASGRLGFSWIDPGGTGLTLPDSTVIFTVRFTALGTALRTVPVTITGNPTPLEFYDGMLSVKSYVLTPGSVNITCEFLLSGQVLTPLDNGIRNVSVTLTGGPAPLTAVTDTGGNYSFKVAPGTYTLTPRKTYELNKTNGISTMDLSLIQAHILQRIPFNSAYKVIAADINNSATVTTADILFLRRLILGADTTLPNNRIWAFVDGDQTFTTPSVAFPFNSTRTYTNLASDISHRFRAIKIGDVNYDRNPQLDEGPAGDTLRLFYTWTDTDNGEVILNMRSKAFEGLMGWQSTLHWDVRKLELLGVTPMMPNLGTGDRWKGEGILTLSWNDPRAEGLSLTEGVEWLQLRFRKTDRLDRTALGLTQERLMTEAFNKSYQRVELRMQAAEIRGHAWEGSMRVYPNPAQRVVNVEWNSAKRGEATIRLMDATGRTVYVHRGMYEAGMQKHVIRRDGSMASGGTWLVQVEMEGEIRNRSVVMAGQEPMP